MPDSIRKGLKRACSLHDRANSDYTLCMEFSKLMSDVLVKLEDARCWDMADKVMSILLDCNPKTGAHCDKATIVGKATRKALQHGKQKQR